MADLSILIPARNEMFLQNTLDDILLNSTADTEIIVVLDGYWPYEPINDNKRIVIIHHAESVGQRAATNEAARLSRAKYVMKCDAHCAFEKGFDTQLILSAEELGPRVTQIPRMYNLHAFNWKCKACGIETYQGPTPQSCPTCTKAEGFERVMVWQRRRHKMTDFTYFDKDLHFQYYRSEERPNAEGSYCDVMGGLGACFFLSHEFWDEIGGLDEAHGSWGQCGTEVACKSWLSGGRQIVNRKTWFSHMFRTQGGDFGFPYPISNHQINHARKHSQDLWYNNKWHKQVRPLHWLVEKFSPVPTWTEVEINRIRGNNGHLSDS